MISSVPTALLKAFRPLEAFGPAERSLWEAARRAQPRKGPRSVLLSPRTLASVLSTDAVAHEEVDVVERDGRLFACPHRSRIRILASILAFARSVPAGAVGAFFAEGELERAAAVLERLRAEHPDWHVQVLESTWEVPLHWFVLFDDSERSLEGWPEAPTIRYETSVRAACARAARAIEVVPRALPNPGVVGALAGIAEWAARFEGDGIVSLDYGSVARLFGASELKSDRSCREIWSAVRALASGDVERASAFYRAAAERWAEKRGRAAAN